MGKLWWWKMPADFFDTEAIRWLREQKNGNEQCLIYLHLLLMTLNTGGVLMREVGEMKIPYTTERIAEMTGSKPSIVKVTISNLKKIGYIIDNENEGLFFPQATISVSAVNSKEANKKRQQRGQNVPTNEGQQRGQNVPLDNKIIRDIDIKILREKEIYKEKEKSTPSAAAAVVDSNMGIDSGSNVFKLYQDNIHPVSGQIEAEQLQALVDECGEANVEYAIKRAVTCNARRLNFISAVANDKKNGVEHRRKSTKSADDFSEEFDKAVEESDFDGW